LSRWVGYEEIIDEVGVIKKVRSDVVVGESLGVGSGQGEGDGAFRALSGSFAASFAASASSCGAGRWWWHVWFSSSSVVWGKVEVCLLVAL
jgi:hypothetical protein